MTKFAVLVALMGCQKDGGVDAMGDPDLSYYQLYIDEADARTMTSISDLRNNPVTRRGDNVYGRVRVQETPTDRGFWIESGLGDRMFALIVDEPRDAWKDIDPGQDLHLLRAAVFTPEDLEQVPGEPLSTASRRIASSQPAFLVVDEADLIILDPESRKERDAMKNSSNGMAWSDFDTDDDDRISRSEYDDAIGTHGFDHYDADGNDEIDDDEWAEGLFENWDDDGDGKVDRGEYRQARRVWHAANVEWPEYTAWDTDGDGNVDMAEFEDWDGTETLFAAYDANQDDAIVAEEYAARTWTYWDGDDDGYVTLVEYPEYHSFD